MSEEKQKHEPQTMGITLRDWRAMMAFNAISQLTSRSRYPAIDDMALEAYRCADALDKASRFVEGANE